MKAQQSSASIPPIGRETIEWMAALPRSAGEFECQVMIATSLAYRYGVPLRESRRDAKDLAKFVPVLKKQLDRASRTLKRHSDNSRGIWHNFSCAPEDTSPLPAQPYFYEALRDLSHALQQTQAAIKAFERLHIIEARPPRETPWVSIFLLCMKLIWKKTYDKAPPEHRASKLVGFIENAWSIAKLPLPATDDFPGWIGERLERGQDFRRYATPLILMCGNLALYEEIEALTQGRSPL